jgi:hypothetical protein
VSLTERDHVDNDGTGLERFGCALREAGLRVNSRPACEADVALLGSSWARRLGIPKRRAAWVLVARKSVAQGAEDLLQLTEREDHQEQQQRQPAGDDQS